MNEWRPKYVPSYWDAEYLATASPADRRDDVETWCRARGRWRWPEVPRRWHETFSLDTSALYVLGRLSLRTRYVDAGGASTTIEYEVIDGPAQLSLNEAVA